MTKQDDYADRDSCRKVIWLHSKCIGMLQRSRNLEFPCNTLEGMNPILLGELQSTQDMDVSTNNVLGES